MAKKKKTEAQKAARKLRRAEKKASAKLHGANLLEMAKKGGYVPIGKPKAFVGKGDYNARTRVLRGRGDYADTIGKVVGDGIGKGASWLARKAGGFLSGLFGFGDYTTHSDLPEQNSFVSGAAVPVQVHSTKDRAFVFRGREEICDIFSSSTAEGVQTTYDVNPGLEDFMEWLSGIAPAFSEWYPNGLVFEFVPAVSPQSADSNGKVAMCVSYDQGDPAPGSFKDMSQYGMSVQFPPWKPAVMAGECKPALTALNWYKVRTGDVAITDEAHSMYDWGKLHIRAGGQANSDTLIGTLFLVYEIVFQKPLAPRPVGRTLTDAWTLAVASSSAYFGTSRTARDGNTLGLTYSGNNTVVMPPWVNHGKFMFTLEIQGNSVTIATPTVTLTGATLLAWFPGGVTSWSIPAAGSTSVTYYSLDLIFEVTAESATIALSAGTIPTASNGLLVITAIDTDVTVLNRRKNHYETYWKSKADDKLQELKYVDDAVANAIRLIQETDGPMIWGRVGGYRQSIDLKPELLMRSRLEEEKYTLVGALKEEEKKKAVERPVLGEELALAYNGYFVKGPKPLKEVSDFLVDRGCTVMIRAFDDYVGFTCQADCDICSLETGLGRSFEDAFFMLPPKRRVDPELPNERGRTPLVQTDPSLRSASQPART